MAPLTGWGTNGFERDIDAAAGEATKTIALTLADQMLEKSFRRDWKPRLGG